MPKFIKKIRLPKQLKLVAGLLALLIVLYIARPIFLHPWQRLTEARCTAGALITKSSLANQAASDEAGLGQPTNQSNSTAATNQTGRSVTGSGQNLLSNPSAEEIGAETNLPKGWRNNIYGTNDAKFSYAVGHSGTRALKVEISTYKDGDADWYPETVNPAQNNYFEYQDYYKANVRTRVVLMTKDSTGASHYTNLKQAEAATDWTLYHVRFLIPADTTEVQVYHPLSSAGALITDDYSLAPVQLEGFKDGMVTLTFDDGWSSIYSSALPIMEQAGVVSTQYIISGYLGAGKYMTPQQVYDLRSKGHEIASHSVDHLDVPAQDAKIQTYELSKAKQDLSKCFGNTTDYAAPYGTYSAATTKLASQYYKSYRTTDEGYNSADDFDPYHLKVQNVSIDTTPEQITAWVATAKQNHLWLILVYHQIEYSDNSYARTPEQLQGDIQLIKQSHLPVVTISQGLDRAKAK
jgi:peptidoglycan/xylan/chitin deacetylase (PgdA/CDA1 family)